MAPAIENADPPHGMHAPRSRKKRARGRDNTRGGGDKEMLRWSEEEERPTFLGGWTGVSRLVGQGLAAVPGTGEGQAW